MKEKLEKLQELRDRTLLGGGKARIDQQHAKGKLTARERLELLLDPGTFCEIDAFVVSRTGDSGSKDSQVLGDGVVTGYGRIDGRMVCVFAQDFTTFGGSVSETHGAKDLQGAGDGAEARRAADRSQRLRRRARAGRRHVPRRLCRASFCAT